MGTLRINLRLRQGRWNPDVRTPWALSPNNVCSCDSSFPEFHFWLTPPNYPNDDIWFNCVHTFSQAIEFQPFVTDTQEIYLKFVSNNGLSSFSSCCCILSPLLCIRFVEWTWEDNLQALRRYLTGAAFSHRTWEQYFSLREIIIPSREKYFLSVV